MVYLAFTDLDSPRLMCSTLVDRGETILFCSYKPPSDGEALRSGADFRDVTIKDTARATSAAPTYLPEMIIIRDFDSGMEDS